MIICSQCGNAVSPNQSFCIECGAQVQLVGKRTHAASTLPDASQTEIAAPSIQPQVKQSFTPVIWLLVPAGVLVLLVVAIVGVKLASSTENRSENRAVNSNSRVSPASPAPTSYPATRVVRCRFNGVNVRDAPSLTSNIITEIQEGHIIRVLRETSNLDTVFIRSRNQDVTDNWSEVELDNTDRGSVHGWIFSGFLR